jgi:hypothetical protein
MPRRTAPESPPGADPGHRQTVIDRDVVVMACAHLTLPSPHRAVTTLCRDPG